MFIYIYIWIYYDKRQIWKVATVNYDRSKHHHP
jgi:hypothetical protein